MTSRSRAPDFAWWDQPAARTIARSVNGNAIKWAWRSAKRNVKYGNSLIDRGAPVTIEVEYRNAGEADHALEERPAFVASPLRGRRRLEDGDLVGGLARLLLVHVLEPAGP